MISSSTGTGKKSGVGSGKETLRLRSKGPATVQVVSENKKLIYCHLATLRECSRTPKFRPMLKFSSVPIVMV